MISNVPKVPPTPAAIPRPPARKYQPALNTEPSQSGTDLPVRLLRVQSQGRGTQGAESVALRVGEGEMDLPVCEIRLPPVRTPDLGEGSAVKVLQQLPGCLMAAAAFQRLPAEQDAAGEGDMAPVRHFM